MRPALVTVGFVWPVVDCHGSCSWVHPFEGTTEINITAAVNAAAEWREHVDMDIIDLPTVMFAGRAIATEAKPALCAGIIKRKYY